jgi:hypothetical protein
MIITCQVNNAEVCRTSRNDSTHRNGAFVRTRLRLFVHYFVYYAARHPEQMRPMVQEGTADSPPFAEHVRPIQNTYGMNRYGTSSQ